MHKHTRTLTHTLKDIFNTKKQEHAHIHTCNPFSTQSHTHTHTYAYTYTHTHTHTRAREHARAHTHTYINTQAHREALMHTYTRTHTSHISIGVQYLGGIRLLDDIHIWVRANDSRNVFKQVHMHLCHR